MRTLTAFAASTSPNSINRKLINYSVRLFTELEVQLLDVRDYRLPIFDEEVEANEGVPENAHKLREFILKNDALLIGVAEHNSSTTAYFKNAIDWISRSTDNYRIFQSMPILLISTSPSPKGGKNALSHASDMLSALGGNIFGKFSIPSFYSNVAFAEGNIQIKDPVIHQQLELQIDAFQQVVLNPTEALIKMSK